MTRKEKSAFNFHILKDALILNFCFASGIKKVSGHIEKRSEKKFRTKSVEHSESFQNKNVLNFVLEVANVLNFSECFLKQA